MNKFMRKLMKKDGFTLVELIVVIAILAILAGVAVPVYSGYISKAKEASIVTELDALATAVQAANATGGAVSKIIIDSDGITIKAGNWSSTFASDLLTYNGVTVTKANGATDYTGTYDITDWDGTSYESGAYWNGSAWSAHSCTYNTTPANGKHVCTVCGESVVHATEGTCAYCPAAGN